MTAFFDDKEKAGEELPKGNFSQFGMRKRNAALFAAVALAWLVLDQLSKAYFNEFDFGELIAGPFAGIFEFRLVHNVGAAWGIFGGATTPLGVLAVAVCVFIVLYLFVLAPDSSRLSVFGMALVFAGGLGNAIDRFTLGYVVDFIEPVFIDFPVFNIADIGVTCGFVIFLAALLIEFRQNDEQMHE